MQFFWPGLVASLPLPQYKLLITSTIPTTLPEVHSFASPGSKQKYLLKEKSNYKTIIPKSTNSTPASSQSTTTAPCSDTLKRKCSPCKLKNPQTNQKIISITSHATFTYPTNTPTTTLTTTHAFIYFSNYFSKNNFRVTGHHPTKP